MLYKTLVEFSCDGLIIPHLKPIHESSVFGGFSKELGMTLDEISNEFLSLCKDGLLGVEVDYIGEFGVFMTVHILGARNIAKTILETRNAL